MGKIRKEKRKNFQLTMIPSMNILRRKLGVSSFLKSAMLNQARFFQSSSSLLQKPKITTNNANPMELALKNIKKKVTVEKEQRDFANSITQKRRMKPIKVAMSPKDSTQSFISVLSDAEIGITLNLFPKEYHNLRDEIDFRQEWIMVYSDLLLRRVYPKILLNTFFQRHIVPEAPGHNVQIDLQIGEKQIEKMKEMGAYKYHNMGLFRSMRYFNKSAKWMVFSGEWFGVLSKSKTLMRSPNIRRIFDSIGIFIQRFLVRFDPRMKQLDKQ